MGVQTIRGMDFHTRYLRYFVVLAEELSFTRAATRLRVSQPALSQRIKALELELGFTLFVRLGRGVALTEQGEDLLNLASGLLGYANRIERLAQDVRLDSAPALLIGAPGHLDLPERTTLISAFTASHPEVTLELETGYSLALFQGVLDGHLDIAMIMTPTPDDRFEWLALKWFPVEVVVANHSELARQPAITPESLKGTEIASFRRARHPFLYDRLIQPLIEAGARVVYPPDQTAPGALAYAAEHGLVLPSGVQQYSDDELSRRGMIRRQLAGVGPVAGLLLIRLRASKAGERFWRFARSSSLVVASSETWREVTPRTASHEPWAFDANGA